LWNNKWKVLITLIFVALAFTMVLPFIWMLSTSFKKQIEVFVYPIQWIPDSFQWANYKEVWTGTYPFALYYWNSLKVTGLSVLGTVVISSATAYALARLHFKGRN